MTSGSGWKNTKGSRGEVLCRAGRKDLTLAELRVQMLPPLARMVAAMCDWGPNSANGSLGDVRYMILDFAATARRVFYVQILTEPGDPVFAEAVSGARSAPVRAFMTPARRSALTGFGFRVGGKARNFQKIVDVPGPAAARNLADELLRILFEVYEYRGRQSLRVQRKSYSRCAAGRILESITIDDVRKMTAAAGLQVRPVDPADYPAGKERRQAERVLRVEKPFGFLIQMCAPTDGTEASFGGVCFLAAFGGTPHVTDALLVEITRQTPFARFHRDEDGDVVMRYELLVAGATEDYYRSNLRMWLQVWLEASKQLAPDFQVKPGAPSASEVLH